MNLISVNKKYMIMYKNIFLTIFFIFIIAILMLATKGILGNGNISEMNNLKQTYGSTFESSLTRSRFALAKSIVDNHQLFIDPYASFTFPDVIYQSSHYYSVFVPGASMFDVPFYYIGKLFNLGVLFSNLLSTIFILLLVFVEYKLLRKLDFATSISVLVTFLVVFATDLFPYSTTLNAHPLSAFSVLLALYAAVLIIKDKNFKIGYPLIWLAFGMGTIMDYPNAVIILPFLFLVFLSSINLINHKDNKFLRVNNYFIISTISALIFLIPLGIYTHIIFGSYFTTVEPHQIYGYLQNGKTNFNLVNDPKFYLNHQIVYKNLSLSLQYTFSGIYALLFSLPRGLFIFSPVLLFIFLGFKEFGNHYSSLFVTCILSIILTLITYGSFIDYVGGWAFGPRYLIEISPILGLFLAFALSKYSKKLLFEIPFLILSIISISISTIGALTSVDALGSPLESHDWTFKSSFTRDIPLINTDKYVSFVYDIFLSKTIDNMTFFIIILSALLGIFIICYFFLCLENNYD